MAPLEAGEAEWVVRRSAKGCHCPLIDAASPPTGTP
ncbi:hypothetical protein J2S56_001735 [Corynebacterium lowii]|nr:hypothetical protein [Corynebacterium lowii]